jgi:hypothetical protein
MNVELVKQASVSHKMTDEILNALFDQKITVDIKLAIINALSWGDESDNNVEVYIKKLEQVHGKALEKIKKSEYTADEFLCMSYLMLMADYSNPEKYIMYVKAGEQRLTKSFSANLILSLANGQIFNINGDDIFERRVQQLLKNKDVISNLKDSKEYVHVLVKVNKEVDHKQLAGYAPEQCKAWLVMDKLFNDKSLNIDMRKQAIDIIKAYVGLYKQFCEEMPTRD